ncbi:CcdB family protein [Prosthecomicrobium sp. N25]|uniref:CcdB family protein n=1 Tax=Prosthecomicrobium sp. N25 TaxID=3129254 RepID=UPI003077267B
MRQFEVFPNPDKNTEEVIPYVVVLRHDRFADIPLVLIAPLIDFRERRPYPELCPVVTIAGRVCFVAITDMASISPRHLGRPVAFIQAEHERILRALDLLICGF